MFTWNKRAIFAFSGCIVAFSICQPTFSDSQFASGNTSSIQDEKRLSHIVDLINSANGQAETYQHASNLIKAWFAESKQNAYAYAAIAEYYYWINQTFGEYSKQDVRVAAVMATRLNKNIALPHVVLAKLNLDENNLNEARQEASEAIKLAPSAPEAMFVMARVSEESQKWEEAEKWYRGAIDAHTSATRKSNTYFWLGSMYARIRPPATGKAKQAYMQSMKLNPDSPAIKSGYARFLTNYTHEYGDAVVYAVQALKSSVPTNTRFILSKAKYGEWALAFLRSEKKQLTPEDEQILARIQSETGVQKEYMLSHASLFLAPGIITEALVKSGAVKNVDIVAGDSCCTALVASAYANNLPLTKLLIAHGANIYATDKASKYTALYYYAINDNVEAVQYLLEHGAQTNIVDLAGNPIAHSVIERGKKNKNKIVKLLLSHHADPRAVNFYGAPLIHLAASDNNVELVAELVEKYKVNLETTNSEELTPLGWAAITFGPRKEIVSYLLKAGSNPWIKQFNSSPGLAYPRSDALLSTTRVSASQSPDIKIITSMIVEARKNFPMPADFYTQAEFLPR